MTNAMPVQPTTAASWRVARRDGFVITLPSGNVAKLRPVALDVLITSGKLPDILTPIAAKSLWVEEDVANIANVPEMAKGFADLVNFILPAAFMEPRVVCDREPGEGEIHIEDIDFEDKVAVFTLATSGAATLNKFREQQARNVVAIPDSEGHSVKTKRPGKNKGSLDGAPV